METNSTRAPVGASTLTTKATRDPIPFIHPDDMPARYALTGRGTCMLPLIEDGACLAFDKTQPPSGGDLVGIVFTREAGLRRGLPGLCKRLVSSDFFGSVIVEQINPPDLIVIPASEVLAIHKMIGAAKTQGNGRAVLRLPRQEAGK